MPLNSEVLPVLPSALSINKYELKLLLTLVQQTSFLSKNFDRASIDKVAKNHFYDERVYENALCGLLNHGVIYSFRDIDSDFLFDVSNINNSENKEVIWYLHAEKTLQALANHKPEVLIGKQLLKFECDDEVFDGGFVESGADVFVIIMDKLKYYFGDLQDQKRYLPSFLRLYQYIGLISAEGFYETPSDISISMTGGVEEAESSAAAMPMIPKYSVMKKVKNQSWVVDNTRICVCIN